ncbi:MAG: extracellular solute-binding protein [Hydrogenophilus sp.]|nr:extracellular solute-binding protein [Hydrogenophilus sp.]
MNLRSLFFSLAAALFTATVSAAETLTVYTSRNEQLIQPIFAAFEAETGIKIRFTTDKDGALIERLKVEGANTPADLLITVDAGNLWLAKNEGVLRPITSDTLNQRIPPHLRDPDGTWYGVSLRARPVMRHATRVAPDALQRYEDLADPKWKGKLCLRTSKNVYNQSLVAMMIAELGEARTEEILRGWIHNLAEPPFPNDTAAIQAVAAGLCDLTIANTYYLARLIEKDPNFPVLPVWTHIRTPGVHINVSGVAVTRHAKNPQAAIRFLEWLTTPAAQQRFAELNHEYPVVTGTPLSPIVARWGELPINSTPLAKAGELQRAAVQLMDRVGWR